MPCLGAFPVFLMPGLTINPIRVLFHGIFPIFEAIDTMVFTPKGRIFSVLCGMKKWRLKNCRKQRQLKTNYKNTIGKESSMR